MRIVALVFCLLFPSLVVYGQEDPKPIASVEEGVRLVQSFKGKPQDFVLADTRFTLGLRRDQHRNHYE